MTTCTCAVYKTVCTVCNLIIWSLYLIQYFTWRSILFFLSALSHFWSPSPPPPQSPLLLWAFHINSSNRFSPPSFPFLHSYLCLATFPDHLASYLLTPSFPFPSFFSCAVFPGLLDQSLIVEIFQLGCSVWWRVTNICWDLSARLCSLVASDQYLLRSFSSAVQFGGEWPIFVEIFQLGCSVWWRVTNICWDLSAGLCSLVASDQYLLRSFSSAVQFGGEWPIFVEIFQLGCSVWWRVTNICWDLSARLCSLVASDQYLLRSFSWAVQFGGEWPIFVEIFQLGCSVWWRVTNICWDLSARLCSLVASDQYLLRSFSSAVQFGGEWPIFVEIFQLGCSVWWRVTNICWDLSARLFSLVASDQYLLRSFSSAVQFGGEWPIFVEIFQLGCSVWWRVTNICWDLSARLCSLVASDQYLLRSFSSAVQFGGEWPIFVEIFQLGCAVWWRVTNICWDLSARLFSLVASDQYLLRSFSWAVQFGGEWPIFVEIFLLGCSTCDCVPANANPHTILFKFGCFDIIPGHFDHNCTAFFWV